MTLGGLNKEVMKVAGAWKEFKTLARWEKVLIIVAFFITLVLAIILATSTWSEEGRLQKVITFGEITSRGIKAIAESELVPQLAKIGCKRASVELADLPNQHGKYILTVTCTEWGQNGAGAK